MVSIFILLLPFILYIFHYYFTFCFLVFQIFDWRLIYELFFFFDIRNLGFTFSLITQGLAQVLIEMRQLMHSSFGMTSITLYSLTKGISKQEILKETVQKMPLNFALLLSQSL